MKKIKSKVIKIEDKLNELVDSIDEIAGAYGYAPADELDTINESVDAILMLVKELKKEIKDDK